MYRIPLDRLNSTPTAARRGVLVVDDNSDQCDFFAQVLPRVGEDDVYTASSGEEALAFLRTNAEKIGLVICDLQMPGMDGMALLRRIGESSHDLAVIVSSAADASIMRSVELMGQAMGLHVLGSLSKPVDRDKLLQLLQKYRETPSRVQSVLATPLVADDFDRALAAGELVPYFQPKVNLRTGAVTGVEALARWIHPQRGVLLPADFLSLIDSPAKLAALTQVVLASALSNAVKWRERGCNIALSVNLSLIALDNDLFCEDVQTLLIAHGLRPEDLTFEILESAAMTDVGRTLETVTRLRLNGFRLATDDFGTGFSSFEQLSTIPFTELKIDRAFVYGAHQSPRLAAVVRSCIELADRLQLKTVAEGVESREDWNFIAGAGASEAQGYFVSRALPGEEIVSWVEQWTHKHGVGDGFNID